MSSTLVQTRPTTPFTIWPDIFVTCLFSLLGLMLSALVLSFVSSEAIGTMLPSLR